MGEMEPRTRRAAAQRRTGAARIFGATRPRGAPEGRGEKSGRDGFARGRIAHRSDAHSRENRCLSWRRRPSMPFGHAGNLKTATGQPMLIVASHPAVCPRAKSAIPDHAHHQPCTRSAAIRGRERASCACRDPAGPLKMPIRPRRRIGCGMHRRHPVVRSRIRPTPCAWGRATKQKNGRQIAPPPESSHAA